MNKVILLNNSFICKIDLITGVAKLLNPKIDSNGLGYWKSVAVDPNSTKVVYVARGGDYCKEHHSLQRSIDGGETWYTLTSYTLNKTLVLSDNEGGYEVSSMYVDPTTGVVYLGTGCYGFAKIPPPYDINNREVVS